MKISVIVAARKNSKWLAQFILGYLTHTKLIADTELLVMCSARDTWNKDLIDYFGGISLARETNISFLFEDYRLGRAGHHVYLNELAKRTTGEWILELCEDMAFITPDWDEKMREQAARLDSRKIYMLCPHFKSPFDGAMAHLVSRGYLAAAGNFAECWSVDSWINTVFEQACPRRALDCPNVWFYDYTHDKQARAMFNPSPLDEVVLDAEKVAEMPAWGQEKTGILMAEVVGRLQAAVAAGR